MFSLLSAISIYVIMFLLLFFINSRPGGASNSPDSSLSENYSDYYHNSTVLENSEGINLAINPQDVWIFAVSI